MLTNFGKLLRKLRVDHNLTLGALGKKLGVSAAFLSAVETGKKPVPTTLLKQLHSLLALDAGVMRELERAAATSMNEVVVDLKGRNNDRARELAVAFARRFETMSDEEVSQMLQQLDKVK